MKLPALSAPETYAGLYVFDFGEWSAVGYTAEEIAVLLESREYAGGKVFKIHRALPDGTFELRGVSQARFALESGLLFYRSALGDARRDFDELCALAEREAPPCRAFVHLADRGPDGENSANRYVTLLAYPAEYEDEISRWLSTGDYAGGGWVEGGPSTISNYRQEAVTILERRQLWSTRSASRSAEEVINSVRRPVQR